MQMSNECAAATANGSAESNTHDLILKTEINT